VPRLVLDLRRDVQLSSSLAPIMNTGSSISTCRSPWWKPDATAMNDCRSSPVIFSCQSILSWLKSRS